MPKNYKNKTIKTWTTNDIRLAVQEYKNSQRPSCLNTAKKYDFLKLLFGVTLNYTLIIMYVFLILNFELKINKHNIIIGLSDSRWTISKYFF